MQSNHSPIGKYIRRLNIKNKGNLYSTLLGINIDKYFMPSVANVVGTDLSKYKIVKPGQFACNRMHVGRDYRLPIALSKEEETFIVSPAYDVFEIIDGAELLPEYLMMWFSRAEFDRNSWFYTDTDVRGKLGWDSLCGMHLPVPSLEKQQEMVNEYNIIANRIKLNDQLNDKLEETAQALYKYWFVDFEFPDNDGKPYRSSGGSMVYNEELDREIPAGWEACSIKDFCSEMKSGATPSRAENSYWNKKDIPWIKTGELRNSVLIDAEEYISLEGLKNSSAKLLPKNTVLVAMYGQGNTKGQVGYLKIEASTNQACCSMICKNEEQASFLYYHLRVNQEEIVSVAIGGAQPNLSKEIIENVPILKPKLKLFDIHPFVQILGLKESTTREIKALNKLQALLLSKMATVETELELTM